MNATTNPKFTQLLQLDWLRPERAIMKYFKTKSLEQVPLENPALDLSCGDGSLMFLHFGGAIDPAYDHFLHTRAKEFRHDKFVDMFDVDTPIEPPIVRRPDRSVSFGTDWKQALLNKAERFGAHDNLILHDNNVLPLPFETGTLATVFSNAIYWIPDVGPILRDTHRIVRPGGSLVLQVMTPWFLHTLEKLEPMLSPAAIHILDRNRRATMPASLSHIQWAETIAAAGFKVETMESMFPTEQLIDIWNVGMRPIAHLLTRMANNLPPKERAAIKREWVEIFLELLVPLVEARPTCPPDRSPYLLIVGRKCR